MENNMKNKTENEIFPEEFKDIDPWVFLVLFLAFGDDKNIDKINGMKNNEKIVEKILGSEGIKNEVDF